MNEKIDFCPFCGSENVVLQNNIKAFTGETSHYVTCNSCKASGPSFKHDEAAIEGWNERKVQL